MFVTGKRLEIAFVLGLQCLRKRRRRLTVECAERIYVAATAGVNAVRTVLVTDSEKYSTSAPEAVFNRA